MIVLLSIKILIIQKLSKIQQNYCSFFNSMRNLVLFFNFFFFFTRQFFLRRGIVFCHGTFDLKLIKFLSLALFIIGSLGKHLKY